MSLAQSVSTVYRKYAVFNGRASRAEFWWFQLFFLLTYIALLTVLVAVSGSTAMANIFAIVTLVFVFASIIPSLSVTVRRLHDANLSGFYFFLTLIPFIGGLVLIVLVALPSVNSNNRYSE